MMSLREAIWHQNVSCAAMFRGICDRTANAVEQCGQIGLWNRLARIRRAW
jgi:hypothetical protein